MSSELNTISHCPEMMAFHARVGRGDHMTIMSVATKHFQAHAYGCVVADEAGSVQHYVEKPTTHISNDINCGVYLLSPAIFADMKAAHLARMDNVEIDTAAKNALSLERDIIIPLISVRAHLTACNTFRSLQKGCQLQVGERLFLFRATSFWSQIKTAASSIYANRHYLERLRTTAPALLATKGAACVRVTGCVWVYIPRVYLLNLFTLGVCRRRVSRCRGRARRLYRRNRPHGQGSFALLCKYVHVQVFLIFCGCVFLSSWARTSPLARACGLVLAHALRTPSFSATSSSGFGGERDREKLWVCFFCARRPTTLAQAHCCILNTIVDRDAKIGAWTRVEGAPVTNNPNDPTTAVPIKPLFNAAGRLEPSITIVGEEVTIADEIIVLNSIVLPHKQITQSQKNEIIL
jgi:NDP-sugar pyrophosphorylase family protein